MSVKKSRLDKTGMSYPDAKGSDRSAIPGRPIAGVDGGRIWRSFLAICCYETGVFHDSNKFIFLKAVYLFSSRNDMIQYLDSYY